MKVINTKICRLAMVAAIVSWLAGCSQHSAPITMNEEHASTSTLTSMIYSCDETQFSVTPLDDEQVLLLFDGTENHLHRVPSASGVKYALEGQQEVGSELELFMKGDQAMLTVMDQVYKNCTLK
ncbi:MliC family protein [Vibrio sp. 10N.261.51.F12]|uniref:MliC family protein n=1 Tax=Vibrio sp. 10N.261.51.F12 TaxID=3229679 RepID=UPI003553AD16